MKLQTLIDRKRRELMKKKKLLKRKAFFLKARIFLTCILPVVIILLAVKVVQTLVRIQVRKAASAAEDACHSLISPKKPVVQTSQKPQFITPVPAGEKTPASES